VFTGDKKYHSGKDEDDAGPEESAHDTSRNDPIVLVDRGLNEAVHRVVSPLNTEDPLAGNARRLCRRRRPMEQLWFNNGNPLCYTIANND